MSTGSTVRIYGRMFVIGTWGIIIGLWVVTLIGQMLTLFGGPSRTSSIATNSLQSLYIVIGRGLLSVYVLGMATVGIGIGLTLVGFILIDRHGR